MLNLAPAHRDFRLAYGVGIERRPALIPRGELVLPPLGPIDETFRRSR